MEECLELWKGLAPRPSWIQSLAKSASALEFKLSHIAKTLAALCTRYGFIVLRVHHVSLPIILNKE